MQLSAITKLRVAFVALGVMLFVPLGWLLHSVNVRVEAQRRLRHQVVAERIFDELERELTRVLADQSARPSSQFDSEIALSPSEPYVLGYFKAQAGLRVVNVDPDPERRLRVQKAVVESGALLAAPQPQRIKPAAQPQLEKPSSPTERTNPEVGSEAPRQAAPTKSLSPAEVMRKLNRAGDERRSNYR